VEAGVALWSRLVQGAGPVPGLQAWLLLRISEAWSKGRQGDKARSALQDAFAEAGDAPARVALWEALGESFQYANEISRAEASFRSALETGETAWGESSLQVAGALSRLGNVLRLQSRLDEAAQIERRGLEIRERCAPDSLEVADSLHQLFLVEYGRKDMEAMTALYRRAQAIQQRWPPDTLAMADTLNDLGFLEMERYRIAEAAAAFERALAILEQRSPESLQTATTLARLALVDRYLGDPESTEELLQRALAIRQKLAPESLGTAAILSNFGTLARERGDLAKARDFFELAGWTPAAGEGTREALDGELGRLRRERDEIDAKIRAASPRLAALRQPQPLDLAAARKVLDPGTLALSYSVGEGRILLFAVTREGGLQVKVLPVGEERLRRDVERFLEDVRQPAPGSGAAVLAQSLYGALIAPVAGLVERSERVLILPDGPLHRLPFGALIRDTGGGARQYLTEWKPLHTALSLTVYGALRASRGEPRSVASSGSAPIVAFGDPRYPQNLAPNRDDPALRGLRSLHGNWEALPYTRSEVERIAQSYPDARLYLGEGATEEQAKAVGREARVLHFATHGYLDDRSPLDSALVLSIPDEPSPGRDNGLLQVWEIFESVRLDADLVVLSACESALGRELSGEGLIGLTRAFQYAGARSVVASLWSVSDQATAELMARFHRHYAAGLPKDEALRQAQIELIHEPIRMTTAQGQTVETDASAPFFWAAFQLFGDWR